MTEPPEPRRPEESGGDEDYDAIWDSADADEIMDGLEDDALLDSIRDGIRGDIGPDELTELLAGLRDEPDAHDIPVPLTSKAERGEQLIGAPQPMSISEGAGRLRQLSGETVAQGAIMQASEQLESAAAAAMNALGDASSDDASTVQQMASNARQMIDSALEAVNLFYAACGEIAGKHGA